MLFALILGMFRITLKIYATFLTNSKLIIVFMILFTIIQLPHCDLIKENRRLHDLALILPYLILLRDAFVFCLNW